MDNALFLLSFIISLSFLQEIYQCRFDLKWFLLFLSVYIVICYHSVKMILYIIHQQEDTSIAVTNHVKRVHSLSKYDAPVIDSAHQIRLIGLNKKENEVKEKEEEEDDYLLHQENHSSGRVSPTPSLSTASTTSSASFDYHHFGKYGKVEQLIHLFESGQLYQFNTKEKKPFIVDRRFDFDPTSTGWKKRTLK